MKQWLIILIAAAIVGFAIYALLHWVFRLSYTEASVAGEAAAAAGIAAEFVNPWLKKRAAKKKSASVPNAAHTNRRILPIIVASQFFCTSLWFAGNAVMSDIARSFHVTLSFLAQLTSAVQLGFISGTLYSRSSPSQTVSRLRVYFFCRQYLHRLQT